MMQPCPLHLHLVSLDALLPPQVRPDGTQGTRLRSNLVARRTRAKGAASLLDMLPGCEGNGTKWQRSDVWGSDPQTEAYLARTSTEPAGHSESDGLGECCDRNQTEL